ncbi:MAG: hypothetical protein ABIV10_04925, partial [Gemmatimonadaceae bacterium]
MTQATESLQSDPQQRIGSPAVERAISVVVQPEVALHQTKGGTARRHLARGVLRVLSVAVGDAIAAALAALVVQAVAGSMSTFLGPAPIPYSSVFEFCGAVVMALLLTGSYRRSAPHPTLT